MIVLRFNRSQLPTPSSWRVSEFDMLETDAQLNYHLPCPIKLCPYNHVGEAAFLATPTDPSGCKTSPTPHAAQEGKLPVISPN